MAISTSPSLLLLSCLFLLFYTSHIRHSLASNFMRMSIMIQYIAVSVRLLNIYKFLRAFLMPEGLHTHTPLSNQDCSWCHSSKHDSSQAWRSIWYNFYIKSHPISAHYKSNSKSERVLNMVCMCAEGEGEGQWWKTLF